MAAEPAKTRRLSLRMRVQGYFLRHLQTLLGALGRMTREPLASIMTVAVIGIALALPACLHLLVVNGKALSGSWKSVADISVYLDRTTSAERVQSLAEELRDWPEVATLEHVPADAALDEFAEFSGFGDALGALEDNPLPELFVITPGAGFGDADSLAGLADALRLVPEVDIVQIDTAWVKRFNAILDLIRRSVALTGVLLAMAVILIVGNTIRLDIENRRNEIEVTKLVGGSDAFVRRPFLYSGLWYGLGGGLLASILVALALLLLRAPVARLAGEYGSGFQLRGAGLDGTVGLIVAGALFGWLGSWIATTRHLRRIEPT